MRKQVTLALAVVVLSGCGLGSTPRLAEQTVTAPPPTVAPSSPETHFYCGRKPRDRCLEFGSIIIGTDEVEADLDFVAAISGYELRGLGWLCSDTGEYCVEEDSSVSFPDGHLIKGPKKGTYKGQ